MNNKGAYQRRGHTKLLRCFYRRRGAYDNDDENERDDSIVTQGQDASLKTSGLKHSLEVTRFPEN